MLLLSEWHGAVCGPIRSGPAMHRAPAAMVAPTAACAPDPVPRDATAASAGWPIADVAPRRYPRHMGSFTTALLDALLSAGVPPDRARAVVDLLDRSIDERYSLHAQVLATKRDVAELETRLVRELAEIRERIAVSDGRVRELDAMLSARLADTKSDLLKWTLAALTAQTALLVGMKLL